MKELQYLTDILPGSVNTYWKFYCNDTNNNWNMTDEWNFTVQNTITQNSAAKSTDERKLSGRFL